MVAFTGMMEPVFATDSTFELEDTSPAIGRGIDSVLIDATRYYTHETDVSGNQRPDPVDIYVDIGAFESSFARPVLHSAYLGHIGFRDCRIWPDFHKDTLHYLLLVPDTTIVTPQLNVITTDPLAEFDIDYAADITSQDSADRTTTITVTADDGTTTKTYTVLFLYASSDASLSELSSEKCELDPDFHPDTLIYTVCLQSGEPETPGVEYRTNDLFATVEVIPALDINIQSPGSDMRPFRTTFIKVTAANGIDSSIYEVEFILNDACACNVGISESKYVDISMYPNPFSTFLRIDMRNNKPLQKIEILSLDGRIVRIIDHIDTPSITINRENLYPGLYFLRIHADTIYVRKVIVR